MIQEERINDFINSRLFLILSGIIFVGLTLVAWKTGRFPVIATEGGIAFDPPTSHLDDTTSVMLSLISTVGIALLLHLLNKMFTFVRTYTFLASSSFLLLSTATPATSSHFYGGTGLCLVLIALVFVLYMSYQQRNVSQRSIYIVMTVIATCCTFQYSFALLILLFVLGFTQMRAMSLRGAIAAAMGIITPLWILVGVGIVDITSLRLPQFTQEFKLLELSQAPLVIAEALGVAIVTIVLTVVNSFSLFNYRLQIRVYNAFFTILNLLVIIMMVIDYNNLLTYLPMLNLCLSVQIAHAFTIAPFQRKYIFIVVFVVLVLVGYGAAMAVS